LANHECLRDDGFFDDRRRRKVTDLV